MGKPTGFKEYARHAAPYRNAVERIVDFKEIYTEHDEARLATQASRCMDCGVPFCQSPDMIHGRSGCPIHNLIPEWNDLVYRGHWRDALDRLHKTNNFPEFTGRVCPAPCEGSCVLGITDPAGHHQEHRDGDHRPRLRRRLGRPPAPGGSARASRWRWWAPDPQALPQPRNSTRRVTRSPCTNAPTASVASSCTGFRT